MTNTLHNKWFRLQFIGLFGIGAMVLGQNQSFVGTRPQGMGETFVAIADDGNTIYWNPAGLPGLRRQEFTVSYGNLFGLGLNSSYAGYVYPIRDEFAIGIDWAHLGYDDDELGYAWNHINLGMGYMPFRSLSIGMNGNLFTNVLTYDETAYGKGTGFGMDLSMLWTPGSKFRFGLTGYNVTGAKITYENGKTETLNSPHLRGGIAWRPKDGVTLAADIDDRWHLGAEYWISGAAALRGGLQQSLNMADNDTEPLIYSLGASLRYKALRIDYAYEDNSLIFPTHRISLSLQLRPALVEIKSASIKPTPVFRSLHRHYESGGFADITLKNSSDRDLPVDVSLFVPTTMDSPHEEHLVLPAKSNKQYELSVTFSNEILTATDAAFDHLVQPEVKVKYSQENQDKLAIRKMPSTYVMGRGKLSWDDPSRIASFVTPEDKLVDRLTRDHVSFYRDVLDELLNRSNLGKGMLLFDGLGALGLTYSPDLTTPFIQISKNRSAFDSVKYPSELLKGKVGDCDDLTVLYGSMLENLGMATMFLDVFAPGEGHIFLMFDSGIDEAAARDFFTNEKEYVLYEGRVWIPVETTLVGESFFTAWKQGAIEYHRRKKEGMLKEVDIRLAQRVYPPGQAPENEIEYKHSFSDQTLLKRDLEQYGERIRQLVLRKVGDGKTAEDYYLASTVYLEYGRLKDARSMLLKALEKNPDFSDAQNGIGVSYIMENKFEEALFYLTQAVENNPEHAGYLLNMAITYYLQGKTSIAENVYENVVALDFRFAGKLDEIFTVSGDSLKNNRKLKLTMEDMANPITVLPTGNEINLPIPGDSELRNNEAAPPEIDQSIKAYNIIQARSNNSVGLLFAQRGNLIMALEYFQKANKEDPSTVDYLVNLALANYVMKNYEDALSYYQVIIRKAPELEPKYQFLKSMGKEEPSFKVFRLE